MGENIIRNENGFGSIVKLSGNRRKPYGVRITIGWKDGKQQRKYLGYYKTQQDALVALAEYHKNHVDLDLTKLTLEEVYHRWVQRIEKKVSKSVLENHRMCYLRFGNLANKQIKDIKTAHLQDWIDAIELMPRTKGKIKSTMSQIFDYAVDNDIILKNYVKGVTINEKVEKTGAIFTKEEIAKLWENAGNEHIQDVLILIYTGMRIGEMIELDTTTVNLEERYMIGGNKTDAGKERVIPIHKAILPFIEDRLSRGKYLLYSRTDTKLSYTGMKYRFRTLMENMGMSHKIHDTRKTAVSIMHSNGIPMEVVRIIVGHSGKGVTEQTYLYKSPQELVDAIDQITL